MVKKVKKTKHFLYAKCNFLIFLQYNMTWRCFFFMLVKFTSKVSIFYLYFTLKEAPESRKVCVLLAEFVTCGSLTASLCRFIWVLSILGWHIMIKWGKTDISGCDVKPINLQKDRGTTESVEIRLWHLLTPQITCSLCLLKKNGCQKSPLFSSDETSPLRIHRNLWIACSTSFFWMV